MNNRFLLLIVLLAASPGLAQPGVDLPMREPGPPTESVVTAALSALTGPILEELAQFLAQAICAFADQETAAAPEPENRRWWPGRATRRIVPCERESRIRADHRIVRLGRWLTPRPRTCKSRRSS